MNGPAQLRRLLAEPGPIIAPGTYDCLSAKAVERAGFPMSGISGAAVVASTLGYPDVGLQTMNEILNQARNIARSVDIPITVDADTGYGNAINVMRTIREFEDAGLAGLMFEDQTFPKKCGHFEGKDVIPAEEMIIKIKAACEARQNPDFVIIARTDARGTHGIDEAIRRGKLYAEAGADLVFADALVTVEDLQSFAQAMPVPVKANLNEGGKTPTLHYQELYEMGYKLISNSGMLQRTALRGMFDVLEIFKTEGSTASAFPSKICSLTERSELLGLSDFYALEERLYGSFGATDGSWRDELDALSAGTAVTQARTLPI